MLTELYEWLLQPNQSAIHLTPNLSASSIVFCAYLLTSSRSFKMFAAFVFSECLTGFDFFGIFNHLSTAWYGLCYFLMLALIFSSFTMLQLRNNKSRSLMFWCATMILFLLLMAWDSFINADTETYIYTHYASIIMCIHVCIILSFYRPRSVINGVVDKFRGLMRIILNNYTVQYCWYTITR